MVPFYLIHRIMCGVRGSLYQKGGVRVSKWTKAKAWIVLVMVVLVPVGLILFVSKTISGHYGSKQSNAAEMRIPAPGTEPIAAPKTESIKTDLEIASVTPKVVETKIKGFQLIGNVRYPVVEFSGRDYTLFEDRFGYLYVIPTDVAPENHPVFHKDIGSMTALIVEDGRLQYQPIRLFSGRLLFTEEDIDCDGVTDLILRRTVCSKTYVVEQLYRVALPKGELKLSSVVQIGIRGPFTTLDPASKTSSPAQIKTRGPASN